MKPLSQQSTDTLDMIFFEEIGSTNDYLLENAKNIKKHTACIAQKQTKGRGRQGKRWQSPKGNLYYSLLYKTKQHQNYLASFSMMIAVSFCEVLAHFKVDELQIKYPNDIYYQGKKVAGILVETQNDNIIVGIGCNLVDFDRSHIDQPSADLHHFNINIFGLITELNKVLLQNIPIFLKKGFESFKILFVEKDFFKDKKVKIFNNQTEIIGDYLGINEQGYIVIKNQNGVQSFSLSSLSVRILE